MDLKNLHKWFIQNRESVKLVGEIRDQNGRIPLGILEENRRKNLWMLGVAGTGKSYTMRNMALEDIKKGKAVVYLDPFGTVIESLVPEIASQFGHKLFYLNTGDIKNVLEIPTKNQIKDMIRAKQILLVDFEINKIGEEKMQMYGEVILERILAASQEQFSSRKDIYVYIDELQSFQKGTIVEMINHADTLYLDLVMSHQFLDQLNPEVRSALVNNSQNKIFYRTSEQDREWIGVNVSKELAQKLLDLGSHEFILSTELEEGKAEFIKGTAFEETELIRSEEHQ